MGLSTADRLAAIAEHSDGFAAAARRDLGAQVEHCPGWSVADLVWHLTEVHWFWATIVEGLRTEPPAEDGRPPRPADEDLLDGFVAGAARLVEVLDAADQSARCWTWAGWQQDVAFVTHHQVQEAAVHHWDAAHATGAAWSLAPEVASDAVDEFLHFSVASEDDPDDPVTPPLDGRLGLRADDVARSWTVEDGSRPGTARVTGAEPAAGVPVVAGAAADLLLWLYARTGPVGGPVDVSAVPDDLVQRFRAICFTD